MESGNAGPLFLKGENRKSMAEIFFFGSSFVGGGGTS